MLHNYGFGAGFGYSFTPKEVGRISIRLFGRTYEFIGGPFTGATTLAPDRVSIKLAAEVDKPCDISIPTKDFDTPNPEILLEGLRRLVVYGNYGTEFYVGCAAGKGRTGLFLASLAALAGEITPVAYVRRHYYPHAVETKPQEAFVRGLPINEWRRELLRHQMETGTLAPIRNLSFRDGFDLLMVKMGRV